MTQHDTERYERFFMRVPIGLYQTRPDGRILDANPALLQMMGYATLEAFASVSAEQIYVNPADRQNWQAMMDEEGMVRNYELELRRADGRRFWARDNAVAVRDPAGRALTYEGSLEDITERRQAEESAIEQRRSLQLVISSMPNLLIKVDEQDRLSAFAAPPRFQPFFKASDSPLHQPLADFLPAEIVGPVVHALQMARQAGQASTFEHSLTVGDQTSFFDIRITPVSDSQEVLVLADNITERKQAELAEHEQRMLAEALRDIAIALNSTLDLNEVLVRILAHVERVVPYDAANMTLIDREVARVVGRRGYAGRETHEDALPQRHTIAEIATLRQMIESGKPLAIADTQAYPGWVDMPETRWVRSYAGAPILIKGETIGFINLDSNTPGFFTPAHLERLEAFAAQAAAAIYNAQLYQSIQQQALELETANRELEAFGHTVAHDLKAPLQVAVGYVSLLEHEYAAQIDAEGASMLSDLQRSLFRMSGMIESLLLLASLRNVEETITVVEMRPVAEAAVDRFRDQIANLSFEIQIAPEFPPALGYGPWLEEVFANLIGNAIKYSAKDNPKPRIAIRGEALGTLVRYEVQDNGLGISPKDQAHLFEMFSRFHTGHASGFGLGLSIVQRVVTRLHGQVGVVSAPGEGSTFWFTLPAPESRGSSASAER